METKNAVVELMGSWFLPAVVCSGVKIQSSTPSGVHIPFTHDYMNVLAQADDGATYMDPGPWASP